MTTPSDIVNEFEKRMFEMRKPKNRLTQWVGDYALMVFGIMVVIIAMIWLNNTITELNRSMANLTPDAETSKANIGSIGILLSVKSFSETFDWGVIGFGFAAFGCGLALYTHRVTSRTNELFISWSAAATRLLAAQIDRVQSTVSPSNKPGNARNNDSTRN
jgi:hypothetical protein